MKQLKGHFQSQEKSDANLFFFQSLCGDKKM